MAKYGMYPQPVYHATLDDGRTIRMTVWQRADAPTKGFDFERCRRVILGLTDYPQAGWNSPTIGNIGRRIIAAHLEQEGVVLADDPLADVKPKKARNNNAAILAALRAYMQGKPEAQAMAEMALAA